jgi:hypothetical protein
MTGQISGLTPEMEIEGLRLVLVTSARAAHIGMFSLAAVGIGQVKFALCQDRACIPSEHHLANASVLSESLLRKPAAVSSTDLLLRHRGAPYGTRAAGDQSSPSFWRGKLRCPWSW